MAKELKHYKRLVSQLEDEVYEWKAHWADIAAYMTPRRGKYLNSSTDKRNDGAKKNQKIINGVCYDAIQIISAGIQGGLTSPARPWFTLATTDEKLKEIASVKQWLHTVRKEMLNVFSRSNFYNSLHQVYAELATFGVCPMLIEQDDDTVIRCRPFTIGEYTLSLDARYRVDTMCRKFTMTARQIVQKFGEENVSQPILSAIKTDRGESEFEIIHVIEPNSEKNSDKDDSESMEYSSVYFEVNSSSDDGKFLRKSGYHTMPFVAPRWSVSGVDTYGDSPGMNALGDAKQLQKMEILKLRAIELEVHPPVNAPTSMKGDGVSIVAGDVNYVDASQGNQTITPAFQVQMNLNNISAEIQNVEARIRRFFFNDLFMSLFAQDKTMTATEVNERSSERLLILGSVIERIQSEMLDTVIDRVFDIMYRKNLFPPPPQELQDSGIKIEYISMLAQAQKMIGTRSIEQVAGFVGNLAAANPEVLDKLNFDQSVDEYAEMIGVPPQIIRSDDEVAEMRAARAEQQAAAQQQEQMNQSVGAAKLLSETKMNENTALDAMLNQ